MSTLDVILAELAELKHRVKRLESLETPLGGSGNGFDADTVDNIHAATTATANKLLALNANGFFLNTQPCAAVYNSGTQSIPNSAWTDLTFDSEVWDTDGMHSTSVNTNRLTATRAGIYHVSGYIKLAANATGLRGVAIGVNGTTSYFYLIAPISGQDMGLSDGMDIMLAAGGYVTLQAFQNSGGALNAAATCRFAMHYISN